MAGEGQAILPRQVDVEYGEVDRVLGANGTILVIDYNAGTGGRGALFRVDPLSGARTVLSDFGSGANPGINPSGVAVEPNGTILVVDRDAGTGFQGALFRVDPLSGRPHPALGLRHWRQSRR